MTRYKAYPAYKESGVEWLGKVPDRWSVRRLRQLIVEPMTYGANESADDDTPDNPRYIRITDIDEKGRLREETFRSLPNQIASQYLLREGDFLLARSGATVGKSIRYQKIWGRCCYAGYLIRVRPDSNSLYPAFLDYSFQSDFYWQYIGIEQIQATIQNVSAEKYGEFSLPLPSISEQQVIAAHLDHETTRIDGLVEKKTQFIELLREKRQALITHAVTKGLDPNAKMKDSGVEWLGEVPEHWSSNKIKFIARFYGGGTPTRDNPDYWNGSIPWVSPKDMKCEEILSTEDSITDTGLINSSACYLEPGHVLIVVRSGILKHTIPVAINAVFVTLNQDMKALRFDPKQCLSQFFLRWVQGLNDDLLQAWLKQGATVESIEYDYLADTIIPLPSVEEQVLIATHLERETTRIDTLIAKTQRSIELLKERRAALITAAVTGQIDLRDAA